MKRYLVKPLLLSLLIITLLPLQAPGGEVLDRVRDCLKNITSLKGGFTQTTIIGSMERKLRYSGVFYLLKPDMMRWDYLKGSRDQAYLKGDEMVLYQPEQNQVFLLRAGKTVSGRSPLSLLLDLDDIEKDYRVMERKERLVLFPKAPSMVSRAEMVFGEGRFPIKEIVLTDTSGNRTTIRIDTIKINPPLKPDKFRFSPPEGVTVIDRR